MTTLSESLREYGRPRVREWVRLPLLAGVAAGDLPIERFRNYLQQDYLYLREYTRLYSRLAAAAPEEHVDHLIRLAANLVDVELESHRRLGEQFGATFTGLAPSPECSAYISFLRESSEVFSEGLVAVLPCLWGYGEALSLVPRENAGIYRPWLDVYAGGAYDSMIERHCLMLDEADVPEGRAYELFDRALEHEIGFWNQEVG